LKGVLDLIIKLWYKGVQESSPSIIITKKPNGLRDLGKGTSCTKKKRITLPMVSCIVDWLLF
jgi:hypothetical protein